jgi:hypothetical protein
MAKKCHTVGTILKSNQQFVESEGKSIVLTHIKWPPTFCHTVGKFKNPVENL